MRNAIPNLVLVFLVGGAGLARADSSGDPPWPRLYTRFTPSFVGDPQAARDAVAAIGSNCIRSELSRVGPSRGEAARCERAEKRALALGTDGAQAAFALLDREGTRAGARERLYDLIARAGDPRAIEPLVLALERINAATEKYDPRSWESRMIGETLRGLSFAGYGAEDAWGDQWALAGRWRGWLKAHRGMSRGELLVARTVEARREKSAKSDQVAAEAADFLARQPETRKEGLAALRAIGRRPDLDTDVRFFVESAVKAPLPAAPAIVPEDRRV